MKNSRAITRKEKIKKFIEDMEESENVFIPQFCHNLKNPKKLYYGGPWFGKEELVEAMDTFLFGKWLSSGHKVNEFEEAFSKKINQKHGLMVNSGSSANLVAIAALKKHYGWKDGDEIIVSVVGFPTTVNPIIQNGLKPVFIDIEMDSLNFDLSLIQDKISERTRGIFVSPVLGNTPNIDDLTEICQENNILPILDCCDSLGSKWRGKDISEYFSLSTFSFYPAHHITTGEGGMITSNDPELMKLCRSMAWWGRDCYCVGVQNLTQCGTCGKRFDNWIQDLDTVLDHKYLFTNIGYNLKPLDMQGAIGLVQLGKLDEIHRLRKEIKGEMEDIIQVLPKIRGCSEWPESDTSWFGVPVVCEDKETKRHLVDYLETRGVQTRNYFAGNLLYQPAFRGFGDVEDYPNANKVLDLVFFLGCSPTISSDKIEYFKEIISEYKNGV